MKNIKSLLIIVVFFTNHSFTQVNKEIGVRVVNLTNCDLVLKKQKTESAYNRNRFSFGFTYTNLYGSNDITTNFGYHFAREKRKNIEGNFLFLYGLEPGITLSFLSQPTGLQDLFITPKIGYLVALQYNIQSKLYINVEIIPSIYTSFMSDIHNFVMGFNSSSVGLTFGYRFVKH